ncbi:MAG: family 16 glycoside hydrolase, partial [Planctomycetota bacterium]
MKLTHDAAFANWTAPSALVLALTAAAVAQTPAPPPAPVGLQGLGYTTRPATLRPARPIPEEEAPAEAETAAPAAPDGSTAAPATTRAAEVADDPTPIATDRDAYDVEFFPLPDGCVLEVGGMAMTSDGALYVSTRRGQVWRVDDPLADDIADAKVTLFHEGLWEGLGLDVVDDQIFVVQRGELSRLDDVDGDGRCDAVVTIADDWGLSGHYHEFAFGLPRTADGDWFVGLNVSFGDPEWWHGRSTVPYRGWILKVSPDGTVLPWASGLRSPNGIALDRGGDLYVTDNQGDWVASSPIYRIEKDRFYSHPKSLDWTPEYRAAGRLADDEIPPPEAATGRTGPAIWIPYQWSRSTGNLLEDTTNGRFGVHDGQFVVAELTNGMILRAGFEDVQGQRQGWITPLVEEIGSVNRVFQAEDGTVLCGLTNRGWGGLAPADGLARVRFKGRAAMEIESMRILDVPEEPTGDDADEFGFELTLARPVADGWAPTADAVKLVQYDYDYWWEYGSPERHMEELELASAALSEDRTKLRLRFAGMLPAMCVRLTLDGVTAADGSPLLHDTISYTVNQLPSGPPTNAYVAKTVPPPPSKQEGAAGVLHLSWGDALEQFDSEGWELCAAEVDAQNPARFAITPGSSALVNAAEGAGDFTTRGAFADFHLRFDFMLPEGGATSLGLGNGAERVRLVDDAAACGGLTKASAPPRTEVYAGAGQWTNVQLWYRAERADEPARIQRLDLNGVTVQEDVALAQVGRWMRGDGDAAAPPMSAPIAFGGTDGPVALRDIRVKPLGRPSGAVDDPNGDAGTDWTFLDAAGTWDDWEAMGDADFSVSNEGVAAKGALGWLWAPVDELGDVEVRFRAKVNANGAGALVLRARDTDAGVEGCAVRIDASYPAGGSTGTLSAGDAKAEVNATLVPSDTWVDVAVAIRDREGGGTDVDVSLNGVAVNRLSLEETLEPGGIALRTDHDGSVVR